MSEVIDTPQAQPKVEISGLDRLSSDVPKVETIPEVKESTTTPEQIAETEKFKTEAKELGLSETATKEELETAKTAKATEALKTEAVSLGLSETATKEEIEAKRLVKTDEWTVEEQQESEGSWKSLIEARGYVAPEDYSEDKGHEIFNKLIDEEVQSKIAETKSFREAELLSDIPNPEAQAEARLIIDLMRTGQTLEQINAPFEQIKMWRSMGKEELVRKNLELTEGMTPDVLDHKMEQIISGNLLDLEYKSLMLTIDLHEKNIVSQRQQQIQSYNLHNNQIKEQKRQQEYNSFKTALDKVPTFMDKKLSPEVKTAIANDFANGYAQQLVQNPEKLAKFMLYDKFGEQGIKYLQSRAIEQATLDQKKNQLNIPPITQGGQNRVNLENAKNGMERLEQSTKS